MRNFSDSNDPKSIHFLEVLLLAIICISFACVLLLVQLRFSSLRSLLAGLLFFGTAIVILRKKKFQIYWTDPRLHWGTLLVLLFALLFRLQPSLYVIGEQDQGHYTLNSAFLEKNGGPFIKDHLREELKAQGLDKYYDLHNQARHSMWPHIFKRWHKPGIYGTNIEHSQYTLNFYHLKSMWMAIFSKIFGKEALRWETVFFGLISLLFLSLLSYELAGRKPVAFYLCGVLLAICPWHVFFSRYTLTDLVANAYTSMGLYYLIRFFSKNNRFYLFLSTGAFFSFFFTRISGFVWFPFFFGFYLWISFVLPRGPQRRALNFYLLGIATAYSASFLYGFFYSNPYFLYIHLRYLERVFGSDWQLRFTLGAVLVTTVIAILNRFQYKEIDSLKVKRVFTGAAFLFFIAVFAATLIQMYQLYQGEITRFMEWEKWLEGKSGLLAASHSCIYLIIHHTTPIFFLFLILALFKMAKKGTLESFFLLVLVSTSLYYSAYRQQYISIQYYGLRYFVSELLPFAFVVVMVFLTEWLQSQIWKRLAVYTALFLAIGQYTYYTSFQLQGSEMEGMDESLKQVTSHLQKEDLLIVNPVSISFPEIMSSILYYHDKRALFVYDLGDIELMLSDFILAQKGKVFLMTRVGFEDHLPIAFTDRVADISFRFARLKPGVGIPKQYDRLRGDCRLYEIDKNRLRAKALQPFYSKISSGNALAVSTVLPSTPKEARQAEVRMDGKKLHYLFSEDPEINPYVHYFELPPKGEKIEISGLSPRALQVTQKQIQFFPTRKHIEMKQFLNNSDWTNGEGLLSGFEQATYGLRSLVITTKGLHPYLKEPEKLGLNLNVNGIWIKPQMITGNEITFALPKNTEWINSLIVRTRPFIPSDLRLASTSEPHGLDIKAISLR